MISEWFPGKLGLQQRVLPAYRAVFLDMLAGSCDGGMSVFSGQPLANEQIETVGHLDVAEMIQTRNRHLFNPSSPLYYCWQEDILRWLEHSQPDVLIVEANPRYPKTRSAMEWMHRRKRPVLGWGLGAPKISGFFSGWRKRVRHRFLCYLDGVIAYSHKGAAEYISMGIPTEKVFVAPNAVAKKPGYTQSVRPDAYLGQPKILFVGRLQARKRVDNLVAACSMLPNQLAAHLFIIGDGPVRSELEMQAANVFPSAEFTGALHGEELVKIFKSADLFVLPGTGGLALQEAMGFGLPVIAAEGDGTQDDLVRSENGIRVPANDIHALSQAIETALSNPTRLRQMGAESLRIVVEEVNVERMV